MFLAPIALFAYNRPEHLKRTIDALRRNEPAKASDLFVYSDGPKNRKDESAIEKVRNYIETIDGFKSVTLIKQNKNRGLAESVISGVSEMTRKFPRVIVLEDDLVTSPHFLRYMNESLDLYEKEDAVISIHGYVYPVKTALPETFFLKGADCWGWATWKRGWELFEKDGAALLAQLLASGRMAEFNFNNTYPYIQMLKDQIAGRNHSWAIRWYASAFLKDKLTLYPGRPLVRNIGIDSSGTHCRTDHSFSSDLTTEAAPLRKIEIIENPAARKAFEEFFRTREKNLFSRLWQMIGNAICR